MADAAHRFPWDPDMLASTLSHDLRSPLAAMQVILDSLFEMAHGPLTSEQTDDLRVLQNQIARMTRVVDGLLPKSDGQKEPTPPSSAPSTTKGKATVLVVDDEAGIRDLLRCELEERGYEVSTAADGESAVVMAERVQPDVVLCDIRMPRKDGVTTLREIKAKSPRTEVIMVTGYGTLETAVESMKHGAYDYVTKPCGSETLARLIAKALEKQRLNQKVGELETLNRLKTEFLATMSHELRTPMNTIIGFTGLLLKQAYGSLAAAQQDALERIEVSSRHLLELINNILDLSKLAAERMPLSISEFALEEMVQEVIATLEPQAKGKGLALEVHVAQDLAVRSDRLRLKQVITNLLGNAIKFTDQGKISLSARRGPERLELVVEDTGIGIPAEHLSKIFDEFYQRDPSVTREHGGSGLGLCIVKKIVNLLDGEIDVESTPGAGSVFTVRLPAHGVSVSPVPSPVKEEKISLRTSSPAREAIRDEGEGGRPCVLVIDDEQNALQMMKDMLQDLYEVRTLSDTQEVLSVAQSLRPFAITLDLMMPGKSGWALLKALKNDPLTRDLPVIVTSSAEDYEAARHCGASGYLLKPIEREVLLRALSQVRSEGTPP